MPELLEALDNLGLDRRRTRDLGRSRSGAALTAIEEEFADKHADDSHSDPPDRVGYVIGHAFRGLGLLALIDQEEAARRAQAVTHWLMGRTEPSWPLGLAVCTPEFTYRDDVQAGLGQSRGYAADLGRLLLTAEPRTAALGELGSMEGAEIWTRAALEPYRIDINLLQALINRRIARGRQEAVISDRSAPALLRCLMATMEDALEEARLDEYHWARGATAIQATDPEVVLALRALYRSDHRQPLRDAVRETPMVSAALDLAEALEQI